MISIDLDDHRSIRLRLLLVVLCLSITDEDGTETGRMEDGWQQLQKLAESPLRRVHWCVTRHLDEELKLEDENNIYAASVCRLYSLTKSEFEFLKRPLPFCKKSLRISQI